MKEKIEAIIEKKIEELIEKDNLTLEEILFLKSRLNDISFKESQEKLKKLQETLF